MLTEKMPITAMPRMMSSVTIRRPDSVTAVIGKSPLPGAYSLAGSDCSWM